MSQPLDPRASINWRLMKTECIYEGTMSTTLNIFSKNNNIMFFLDYM